MPTAAPPQCSSRNAQAAMDELQYAALSLSLTRTVLFFNEATLDSLLKHNRKITYTHQNVCLFFVYLRN